LRIKAPGAERLLLIKKLRRLLVFFFYALYSSEVSGDPTVPAIGLISNIPKEEVSEKV
jgi:hypothetical protein